MGNLVKTQIVLFMLMISAAGVSLIGPVSVHAQDNVPAACEDLSGEEQFRCIERHSDGAGGSQDVDSTRSIQGDCPSGYIKLSVPLENGDDCLQEGGNSGNLEDNIIFKYLGALIRFLSIGVGLVVVLMIIIAGIQYIVSAGNPQGIEAAKNRLTNALIALLLYIFMAAVLNFLVPGGFL